MRIEHKIEIIANLLCRILTNQFLFIYSAIVLSSADEIQQQFKLLPIASLLCKGLYAHSGSIHSQLHMLIIKIISKMSK